MVHSDEMDCRKDGVFSFRVPVKPRRQLETPQLKFFNIPVSAQMPEPMVATSSDLITAPPQRTGMETEEKGNEPMEIDEVTKTPAKGSAPTRLSGGERKRARQAVARVCNHEPNSATVPRGKNHAKNQRQRIARKQRRQAATPTPSTNPAPLLVQPKQTTASNSQLRQAKRPKRSHQPRAYPFTAPPPGLIPNEEPLRTRLGRKDYATIFNRALPCTTPTSFELPIRCTGTKTAPAKSPPVMSFDLPIRNCGG